MESYDRRRPKETEHIEEVDGAMKSKNIIKRKKKYGRKCLYTIIYEVWLSLAQGNEISCEN